MSEQARDRIRFLRGMRAVREYTAEPVPDDVINDILEVGRWSGSASNRQPNEIVVVRDKEVLNKLANGGVRAAATAPVAFVTVMPGDPARAELDVFDNGRLVERLLLAARAHGLGGNVSTLKGDGPDVIKQALGIPADRRVWTVVTVGHINREASRARPRSEGPARKSPSSFARWDRY